MLPTQSIQSLCLASTRPAESLPLGKGNTGVLPEPDAELHVLIHPYFTGDDQLAARYLRHARGLGPRDLLFLLTHYEADQISHPYDADVARFFTDMTQILGDRLFICHERSEFCRIDSAYVSTASYLSHVFAQQDFDFTPETTTYFMGESLRSCVAATAKGFVQRLKLTQPATILLGLTDNDGFAQKPAVIQERIRHDLARYGLRLLPAM